MSLWGATVITNLLSAIPVFGPDLVELIFYTDFFVSGTATALNLKFKIFTVYSPDLARSEEINNVFIYTIGALNSVILPILPTIGTLSPHAYKKDIKKKINKSDYLTIPPQFLSYLVGLIDGDGYLGVNSSATGNIGINLTIQLHLDDLSTLEYIHSVLKLGRIKIYKDQRSPNARFILNKTELQDVFFPLLKYHSIFFLTENRRSQFNLAMFIFENNIKKFDQIPNYVETPSFSILPANSLGYLNLPFFKNWVVGFTTSIYKPSARTSYVASFDISQTNSSAEREIISAICKYLSFTQKIHKDGTNNFKIKVSSIRSVENVIRFINNAPVKLQGHKKLQYLLWIKELRNIPRYSTKINIPDIY
uniref:apocytochrome b n=1 Tax=Auricularia villosula TaxID=1579976 RepID=UPI00207AD446|nr:apocytochrome b [Auricularia villosula]URP31176.1 apocytochrome b [Auricularia villosula]